MSKLADLLRELGQNSELAEAYKRDPKDVMTRAGLSDEEIQAMLDKDVETLKKLSGLEKVKSNGIVNSHD